MAKRHENDGPHREDLLPLPGGNYRVAAQLPEDCDHWAGPLAPPECDASGDPLPLDFSGAR